MSVTLDPLVSVIIPVYNQRPDFLKECVESVINQTYENIEIIISDNHSTNETPEVLNTFKDKRIRIVKPPEHLGLTANFQWASEQATGEYISFLPSDDWLENECIEELVNLIHPNPNIVMAFCNVKQYYNGIKADFISLKPGVTSSEDEIQAYTKMSKLKGFMVGCILRRSVYEKVGGIGHGDITFASDRWLFLQMAIHGDGAYSNKPYGVYRNENPARKSRMFLYSEDVVKLFRLIEQNYLEKVKGGQRTLDKEKSKMAFGFLKWMPGSLRAGDMGREEFDKTLANMKLLSKSRFTRSLVAMYSKSRLIPIVSGVLFVWNKYNNAVFKIKNLIRL